MKKSVFKRLIDHLTGQNKRLPKSRQFAKLAENPAGSKFRERCLPGAGRRADGTLRSNATAVLRPPR